MKPKQSKDVTAADLEAALQAPLSPRYLLRLYITGATPRSLNAIENIKTVCEQHIPGGYDLEILDLYQNPALAASQQIIAAPTLVKELPLPSRRMIGDLSDTERLLAGLNFTE